MSNRTFGVGTRSFTRDPNAPLGESGTAAGEGWRTPEQYGAVGDGGSHLARDWLGVGSLPELWDYDGGLYWFADAVDVEMDWLAIQAALYDDSCTRLRGAAGATYKLNRGLHVRNGLIARIDFAGCRIDGTSYAATAPTGNNLVTNGGFSSGAGWANTSLTPRTDWVFGSGAATFTDPAVGSGQSNFGQFGPASPITIQPGRYTVTATITISGGASGGLYGLPYCGFAFTAGGIGLNYGGSPVTKSVTKTEEGTETIGFSFEIFDEPAALYLTFSGGNADLTVTDVVITEYPLNALIWTDGSDFGAQPYDSTTWTGGEIDGPGMNSGVRGFLHQTLADSDTRCHVVDVNIRYFSGAHVYADQAFLNILRGGSTGYSNPCLQFVAGSQNAGENIRVSDHIFYNSGLILDLNGGGEFFFFGTSFDYSDKFMEVSRAATVAMHGCHFEATHRPTTLAVSAITADFTAGATLTGGTSGAIGTLIEVPDAGATSGSFELSVDSGTFVAGEVVTDSAGGSATAAGTVSFGDVMFDLTKGAVVDIVSGEILMAGFAHRGAPHLVQLANSLCTLILPNALYNIHTASGRLATGPGVVRIGGGGHIWPANALLGTMFSDNFLMDVFGGSGRISGPSTASDMSFFAPADGIGIMCALETDGAPATRVATTGEAVASVDAAYGRDATHGSILLAYDAAYSGGAEWRVFYPVQPGRIALDEYWFAKPDTVAARSHGPFSNADSIRTTAGSSLVEVTDSSAQWIGGAGPQPDWGVTISGATATGGIGAGTLNASHTVVERTGAFTVTIDVGTAATSSATGGSATVSTTWSQTSTLIFDRRFWVAVIGYDSVGRPIIGQEAYQGENNFVVTSAAQDWTRQSMTSYYADGIIPADPRARYSRGRAPAWATHMMMVMNWQNVAQLDPSAPPDFFLTDYLANVV
jgi:hypothetical protein